LVVGEEPGESVLIPSMPPAIPKTYGVCPIQATNLVRPVDAQALFNSLESSLIPQPSSDRAEIHVRMVKREIRELFQ
jgi:hypothetical protein